MKHYSREEADLVLAEVIKAQMRDPRFRTVESPWHVNRIYWNVRRWGGWAWSNKRPRPVAETESGPQFNPLDLVPVPHPGRDARGDRLAPRTTPEHARSAASTTRPTPRRAMRLWTAASIAALDVRGCSPDHGPTFSSSTA